MAPLPYYALIALAVALNWGNRAMLLLSLTVGVSLVAPVAKFTSWDTFYPVCAFAEVLVACIAVRLNTRASAFIAWLSFMLVGYHIAGWLFDGYPAHSPYRTLVKICEYAEIIACCAYSRPFLRRLKNVPARYLA